MAALRVEQLDARVVEDEPSSVSLLVQEPDAAVRTNTGLPDHARLAGDRVERPGCELVPVQAISTLEPVLEQERRAVRPPVLDEDRSFEADREVVSLAGGEIPEPRPFVALPLVVESKPLVACDGRPALRDDRHPLVELLADRSARARVDDPERRMDEVAVLRVLEAEQGAVGRKASAKEAILSPHTSDSEGLGGKGEPSSRFAVERYVDGESVAVADSRCHDPGRLGQPLVPAVRDAFEERLRLAPVKRLDEPASGLVTGVVLEPEDSLSIEGRGAVEKADRVIRHLAPSVRRDVPGMQLPRARLVRRVDDSVRRSRRPFGKERHRRAEALLPERESHRVRG